MKGSIHYPSAIGGNNWGGPAIDHSRNIMVVNTMNLASLIVMVPREDCNKSIDELSINNTQARFTSHRSKMKVFHIVICVQWDSFHLLGVPCTKPPWGTLTAVDLNTGDHLWNVPLGNIKRYSAFSFLVD